MTKIIFSEEARQMFDFLRKEAKISKKESMILNALQKKLDIISENTHYGDSVPKRLIPDYYRKKFLIRNLYRVELPCFWRFLYTIKNEEIEIIAFVIDILDHKRYDAIFSYRKR